MAKTRKALRAVARKNQTELRVGKFLWAAGRQRRSVCGQCEMWSLGVEEESVFFSQTEEGCRTNCVAIDLLRRRRRSLPSDCYDSSLQVHTQSHI